MLTDTDKQEWAVAIPPPDLELLQAPARRLVEVLVAKMKAEPPATLPWRFRVACACGVTAFNLWVVPTFREAGWSIEIKEYNSQTSVGAYQLQPAAAASMLPQSEEV